MEKQIVRRKCSREFKGHIFAWSVAYGQLIILCPRGQGLWEPHRDNVIYSSSGPMARSSEGASQAQGEGTGCRKGESIG